jgi:carbonic anhydrase
VVRNVANVAPPAKSGDSSVGAALEYAVKHLEVEDIVVCGHSNCGGVKALMSAKGGKGHQSGHLDRWIEFLRPVQNSVSCSGPCDAERLETASKANVLVQVDNVLTYPCVREAYDAGKLRVHAWYYDMEEGDLYAADEDGSFKLLTEAGDASSAPN